MPLQQLIVEEQEILAVNYRRVSFLAIPKVGTTIIF